ncbi:hypothetical protein B5S33_g36 [[Candida] boidinii]|nr:hypothetical protein B5S33_g36 [[Candida] boidinii]
MRLTVLRGSGINYIVGLTFLFLLSSSKPTYSQTIPTQQNLSSKYDDRQELFHTPAANSTDSVIKHDIFQTSDSSHGDTCVIPENLRNSTTNEICNYITSSCNSSVFSYSKFYYCSIVENSDIKNYAKKKFFSVLSLIALFLFLLILLLFLGTLASYLTTNLTEISNAIGLSDKVAGLTLLSLGNSSPDVFSTYAALKSNSTTLAIGELIGAASIACSVVIGCMALAKPFSVNKESFLKDLSLFSILILITFFILVDGKIKIYESLILIVMYFVYILYMIFFSKDNDNEEVHHDEQSLHLDNGQSDHLVDAEVGQYHDDLNQVHAISSSNTTTEHKTVRDEMYERNVVSLERGYTKRLSLMDAIRLLFGIMDVLYIRGRNFFDTEEDEENNRNPGGSFHGGVPSVVIEGSSNTTTPVQKVDTEYTPDVEPYRPRLSMSPHLSSPSRSTGPREGTPEIRISFQQDEPIDEDRNSDSEWSRSPSPNRMTIPHPTTSSAYTSSTNDDSNIHDTNTNMLPIPMATPQFQRVNSNNSITSSTISQKSRTSFTRSNLLATIDDSRAEMAQKRATLEEESNGSTHEQIHSTEFEISNDTESGKGENNNNINNNNYNLYKEMIFGKIDTENMTYLATIISYIMAPCCLFISLTVPSPWCTETETEKQKFKRGPEIDAGAQEDEVQVEEYEYELDEIHPAKLLTTRLFAIQLLSIPCTLESKSFFNVYFFDPIFHFKFDYQIYLITVLVSILNYLLFKKFQKLYFKYFNITVSVIGFLTCICFINETSSEIIKILKNIGIIFHIRESLLGLTFLALANSTGDLITNVALVVADQSKIALSACFGAPSFYLLLGIGLNSFIIIINNLHNSTYDGDGKANLYQIEFDVEPQLFVSSLCLMFVLSMYAVLVPLNNWKITRRIGLIAVSCWIIMTGINILIEMH